MEKLASEIGLRRVLSKPRAAASGRQRGLDDLRRH